MATSGMFDWFQHLADQDQAVREAIQEAAKSTELVVRQAEQHLYHCHKTTELTPHLKAARELLSRLPLDQLAVHIPEGHYYKFHSLFRHVIQQAVFASALLIFLESQSLAKLDDVSSLLGADKVTNFAIDAEDYLYGICSLPSELARLAMTSVTLGDTTRPRAIMTFVSDLYDGLRLLNLKNDGLRKKYDAIKYDVKRIEGVVFDLAVRGK